MEGKNTQKPRKDHDAINRRTYRAVVWLERAEFWFAIGMVSTLIYAVILFGLGNLNEKPNMKGMVSIAGFLVTGIWLVCLFSTLVHMTNRYDVEAKPSLSVPLGLLSFSAMSITGLVLYISTNFLK